MTLTQLNISRGDLSTAAMWRLSPNLIQNGRFKHNITDFFQYTVAVGTATVARVVGRDAPPNMDTCLVHTTQSGQSATSDTLLEWPIGGPLTVGDKFLLVMWMKAATTNSTLSMGIVDANNAAVKHAAVSPVALAGVWTRFSAYVSITTAGVSGYLQLKAGSKNVMIADVQCYKVEESETLGKRQRFRIQASSGMGADDDLDGRTDRFTGGTRGPVRVTIIDPYVDSDPEWWRRKLSTRGKEWQSGEQFCGYIDGDLAQTLTGIWTGSSATVTRVASVPLVGTYTLKVAEAATTVSTPYALCSLTIANIAGRPMELSAWARAINTGQNMTCPISCYDGTTDARGTTVYTLTTTRWHLIRHAFTPGAAATALQIRLRTMATSTRSIRYDAIKLEPTAYTPFMPSRSGCWALALKYYDGSNYYYDVVTNLRFAAVAVDAPVGQFLYDDIEAVGDDLIRFKQST